MKEKLKSLKNKKTFWAIGILLVALIGGTIAYYSTRDTIDNIFKTKEYESTSVETFESPRDWKPGDTTKKELKIINSGDMCQNVRVSYTENWKSANGANLPLTQNGNKLAIINFMNQDDWVQDGSFFYYKKTLQPSEETNSFIKSVTYNKDAMNDYACTQEGNDLTCETSGDGYDGATYTLRLKVETIDCKYTEEGWGVKPDDLTSSTAMFLRGETMNALMKTLAAGEDKVKNDEDTLITAFKRSNRLPSDIVMPTANDNRNSHLQIQSLNNQKSEVKLKPTANKQAVIASTDESAMPIYMWYDNGTIYWYSDAKVVYTNYVMDFMFSNLKSLTDITGIGNLDMTHTGWASWIFEYCTSLTDISPLASWDMSKTKTICGDFRNCTSLTDISPLTNWDTSSVEDMQNLFEHCYSLENLKPLTNWDTSKVTTLANIFQSCTSLVDLTGVEKWDTSSNTKLSNIFMSCSSLSNISALANWDTSKVTDMSNLFLECHSLVDISALTNWQTGNNKNFTCAFQNTGIETTVPLAGWDTSKVTTFFNLFTGCNNLSNLSGLANWKTSKVENMQFLFFQCYQITSLAPLANWNTSSLKDMQSAFREITSLTTLNGLQNWDVSNVETMKLAFYKDSSLTSATAINNWNINKVKYTSDTADNSGFYRMFNSANGVHPTFSKRSGTWSYGSFVPNNTTT